MYKHQFFFKGTSVDKYMISFKETSVDQKETDLNRLMLQSEVEGPGTCTVSIVYASTRILDDSWLRVGSYNFQLYNSPCKLKTLILKYATFKHYIHSLLHG